MKSTKFIISAIFALGFSAVAHADAVPKRSKDFTGNYQTLVKDQQAAPQVADCIASAYDYVKKSKKYDRLGFTKDDISSAETNDKSSKFSTSDPRKVSAVISVPGEARNKNASTKWDSITLRCGITNGKLKAIELASNKAGK
ncbi:type IV secretion system effector BspC [Brucella sp. LJL56]